MTSTFIASQLSAKCTRTNVDWFGDIPPHWHTARLKDIAQRIISGGTPSSNEPAFWNGDVVWITPQDISKTQLLKDSRRRLTSLGVAACGAEIVPAGSVIVTTRAPVGNVALAAVSLTTNQGCKAVIPRSDALDSLFGFYLLNTTAPVLRSIASGSTFQEISSGAFSSISIPLPPLPEQQAIARFLDRQDRRISRFIRAKQRLIALLNEQKQAIIHQAVTRGLDPDVPLKPSGIDWLGDVPAHWEVTKLYRITDRTRRIMYGIVLPGPDVEEGVYIVKGGNCEPGRLHPRHLAKTTFEIEANYVRSRLKPNDIVFAIRGSIGAAELVPSELEGANLTQDAARIAPGPGIDARWLLYTVRSQAFFAKLEAGAVGATIRGINIRDIKRGDLMVPPLVEQKAIARHLEDSLHEIATALDRTRREIELIREYRTRLIADVVTGKLDVRNHPDAAADTPDEFDDDRALLDTEPEEDAVEIAAG